jgi:hypothetical protein
MVAGRFGEKGSLGSWRKYQERQSTCGTTERQSNRNSAGPKSLAGKRRDRARRTLALGLCQGGATGPSDKYPCVARSTDQGGNMRFLLARPQAHLGKLARAERNTSARPAGAWRMVVAQSPCSAPASWARRSPPTAPTPTCRSCCSTCRRRKATRTASSKGPRRPEETRADALRLPRTASITSTPPTTTATSISCAAATSSSRPSPRRWMEARPLQEGRALRRRTRHLRQQHLRPVDQRAGRGAAGRPAQPLLRHPLLQPAALHAAGRDHSLQGERRADARRAGDLPHHHARQGRGARAGHAELRRQPRRRLLHAGGDAPHRAPRPGLRRGGCADRPVHRPAEERHLPHRRRRRPRHLAHVIGPCRTRCPTIPGTAITPCRGG